MKVRNLLIPGAVVIGGAALTTGLVLGLRKKNAVVKQIEEGVGERKPDAGGGAPSPAPLNVRMTTYWPFTAREDEKKMEGGHNDRKGKRLHTLEEHLADPKAHPYVAVSGDDAIWPYGQRLEIEGYPGVVFRVVDTGGAFRGAKKVYRLAGYEPLDICVTSKKTKVPTTSAVKIVPGDNFAKGAAVSLPGSKVTGILGLTAPSDAEALARMLASERPSGTPEELQAAAWVARNRAAAAQTSVSEMLCPTGECGPQDDTRPFASTAREATARTREIARAVLALDGRRDPTGCAVDFFDPVQQDRLFVAGDGRCSMSADDVREAFRARGLSVLGSIGGIELIGSRG